MAKDRTQETACFLLLLSVVAFATSVQAQFEDPPVIVVSDAEREVRAAAIADSEFFESNQLWTLQGPFIHFESAQEAGEFGSTASTQAEQNSQISSFSIRGDGSAEGSAILGGAEDASVRAHSVSRIAVSFSVPVDAPYSLSGTFAATGEDGGNCLSFTNVSFVGFDPNGFPFFHSQSFKCDSPPENASFFFTGTVGANTILALSVEASVDPRSDDKISALGVGTASFDVLLDFGDRDGDGLLDTWEKEGIDFPGPGVEIDLPGLGADPDKKDLFVEVDVMDGVTYDQQAIDDVILAFAMAPAAMIDNPDETLGIQLHVITDGDHPPSQPFVADPDFPPEFYDTKDAYFGSEDDRNHPDWDNIRRAKLLIYRYCIWADTLFRDDSQTDHALGRAEAVPSNDFIVAAGRVQMGNPNTSTQALAGTFMHELGHTLGLKHGGQDDENNKPNYLSVMNYAYTMPFDRMTSAGSSVADFWRLDYSRSAMTDLDETELYETQGLGGPQGRLIFFNYKEETDPEPVKRGATWADRVTINWNGDQNDPDVAPYQLDITRNDASEPANYDATLESYTDWERLWYHLLGTPDFNDREPSPVATRAEALEETTLEAFANVEWTDFTLLDDQIFSNGFELGSTTAWSDVVP